LLACGRVDTFDARGVVRGVRADERQVTIEHADIPGLMPAMTMSFDVADAELLEGLAPGQYVEFRIARAGDRFEIVALEAPGAGDAGAAGASGASGGGDPLAGAGEASRSSTRTGSRCRSRRCAARPCCSTSSTRAVPARVRS
jgi:Cu/Ag efflux protein CusF